METSDEALKQQLNMETGRIAWPELQRHFARGVVIKVEPGLDLVEVAIKFVKDDKTAIRAAMHPHPLPKPGRAQIIGDADD